MATEIEELKAKVERIEGELESVRAKIRRLENKGAKEPPPFTKLYGAWKGANFTNEEIEAAKIKARDLPD
jgi:hypothetical protein